jgi:hypothetical protein
VQKREITWRRELARSISVPRILLGSQGNARRQQRRRCDVDFKKAAETLRFPSERRRQ